MATTITITRQWQIYIPQKIREALDLEVSDRFEVEVKDNKLVLSPKKSEVMKLAGSIKIPEHLKGLDVDNIRDLIDYSQW